MRVLAGDIGGTHARLALVEGADGAGPRILERASYASAEADGLEALVARFLRETGGAAQAACFGIACRIREGECRAPNLPWGVKVEGLAQRLGLPGARIINDFEAVGYAVEHLGPGDLTTLQEGASSPAAPRALIGPGTGLGEGFVVRRNERWIPVHSEGGHVSFGPRNELEDRVLAWLRASHPHVSYERIVSGPGLGHVYRALVALEWASERDAVRREMSSDDPAAVISRHGLADDDPLCRKTLEIFVGSLGSQAGNLVLTVLATGGVYLAGGIVPRLADHLVELGFLEAFRTKGRLSEMLERTPVHVIMNADVGLLGAAVAALNPQG